jgi:hypothetical protein
MKLSKTAYILSIILWFLWIASLEVKQHMPEFLGAAPIQWGSAALCAILIPIITLLGLKLLSDTSQRKKGFWLIVIASIPLIYNLSAYSVLGVTLAKSQSHMTRPYTEDAQIIATITSQLVELDTIDSREKAAEHLYGMFGIRGVLENSDGLLEVYTPSEEAQMLLEDSLNTLSLVEDTNDLIDSQLKQIPWLFVLYIGTYTLVVTIGLARHAYKSPLANKTLHPTTHRG